MGLEEKHGGKLPDFSSLPPRQGAAEKPPAQNQKQVQKKQKQANKNFKEGVLPQPKGHGKRSLTVQKIFLTTGALL